jgi:hypothetical protein
MKQVESLSKEFIEQLPPSLLSLLTPNTGTEVNLTDKGKPPAFISPCQKYIIQRLNALPNIKKYTVMRPHVRNSHAMMVCLNPKFHNHREGRGTLRHWADNFIL